MSHAEKEPTLFDRLAEPFPAAEVRWKPQAIKGNRASAIAYLDARHVMDRLDHVVGGGNWQDEYKVLDDGSVVCTLAVRVDGEWISKTDVGSLSAQPDAGDRLKAAFSDALKRAAVKWGIGRYLYRLQAQWVDYDPVKKQFTQKPSLPFWAVPESDRGKPAAPAATGRPPKASPQLQPGDESLIADAAWAVIRGFEACPDMAGYSRFESDMQALWPDVNIASRMAMKKASDACYGRVAESGDDVPF